jgi:hypothetical protein
MAQRLPTAVVLAGFAASRLAAYGAGVRFDASQLHYAIQNVDPELLRTRLAESLFYLHGQPPLWNLTLGIVLKIAPHHVSGTFGVLFLALGIVESVALLRLLERLSVPTAPAVVVTVALIASPAFLIFENWLFYDYPMLVALTLSALALYRYLDRPTAVRGLAFFSLLAVVILTRSIFQIVWLVLVAGLVVLARRPSRSVLALSALPLLLVAGVSVKNAVLFGTPTTSSWLGMNLARVTVAQLPQAERERLVREGTLSRVSLVRPFAPLADYAGAVPAARRWGVPVLDEPTKQNGARNLEAATYITISRRYLHDDLWVIRSRPGAYVHGLKRALEDFFQPATHEPFVMRNRSKVAVWDRFYNRFLYGSYARTNLAGVLLTLGYGAGLMYGLFIVLALLRRRRRPDQTEATLLFIALTVLYVLLAGNLTDVGENARFRLVLDPIAAALLAAGAVRACGAARRRRLRFSRADGLTRE